MKRARTILLAAAALALSGGADAQAPAGMSTKPKPAAEGAKLNPIAEDARNKGLKGCVPVLNRVTSQLIGNAPYGAFPVLAEKDAKDRIYDVVISRQLGGGVTQLVSLSVSPDRACSVTYDIHTMWPMSCDQVAAQFFPSYQQRTPMSGNVVMLQEGPMKQVYLVPLPRGCMTMRKDTNFAPGSAS